MRECGTEQGHATPEEYGLPVNSQPVSPPLLPSPTPLTGCRVSSTEPPGPGQHGLRALAWSLVGDTVADPDLGGLAASLQRVCRAASGRLPVLGVAVHLMTAGSDEVAASSDLRHAAAGRAPVHLQRGSGPRRLPDAPARARARPRERLGAVAGFRLLGHRAWRPRGLLVPAAGGRRVPRGARAVRRPRRRPGPSRTSPWQGLSPRSPPRSSWTVGRRGVASWTRDWPCHSVTATVSTRPRAW